MRRYRPTAKQLLFLLVALFAVLALVYMELSGRSSIESNSPDVKATKPLAAPERLNSNIDKAGVRCLGTGLAAVDLAGNCRATPRATMGALEAVDK